MMPDSEGFENQNNEKMLYKNHFAVGLWSPDGDLTGKKWASG